MTAVCTAAMVIIVVVALIVTIMAVFDKDNDGDNHPLFV